MKLGSLLSARCRHRSMSAGTLLIFVVLIAVCSVCSLDIVYVNFGRLECNVFSASTCNVLVFLIVFCNI